MAFENSFKEDDIKQVVDYLNFVNDHAEFNKIKNKEMIQYFKLLSFMERVLIPKMDANVAEIKSIQQVKESKEEKKESPKKSKK